MKVFLKNLLDLFFPPRCPFCRRLLKDYEPFVCRCCQNELPWTMGEAQVQHFRHIESCYSPLFYDGDVRSSILRFKFSGLFGYAPAYAALMAHLIQEKGASFDVVSWVPISAMRLKKRTYDQAELLAREIAGLCGAPCEAMLIKTADNPAQSSLHSSEERRKNVSGLYRPSDLQMIKGRQILLVDDVVTTGATLNECARVLKRAGASGISAVTLARSRRDG